MATIRSLNAFCRQFKRAPTLTTRIIAITRQHAKQHLQRSTYSTTPFSSTNTLRQTQDSNNSNNSNNTWVDLTPLFDKLKQSRELLKEPTTIQQAWSGYEELLGTIDTLTGKSFVMENGKMYQVDIRHLKVQTFIDYGFSKAVMGEFAAAEPVLVKLIQLSNSGFSVDYHKSFRPNAFLYLGMALSHKQEYAAAEEILRHASGSMSDVSYDNRFLLMHELAFSLERQQKLDEAEALLSQIISEADSANPEHARVLSYAFAEISVIRSKQQRSSEVVDYLEKSYKIAQSFAKDHPLIVVEKAIELAALTAMASPLPSTHEDLKTLFDTIANKLTSGSNNNNNGNSEMQQQLQEMQEFIALPQIKGNPNAPAHIAAVNLLLSLNAANKDVTAARAFLRTAIEMWQTNPPKEFFDQAKFLPLCAKIMTIL